MYSRAAILGGVVAAVVVSSSLAREKGTQIDPQNFAQIQRGRYLTILSDCSACHGTLDGKSFAGGRPIETPFGVVAAPNITPDLETGIGGWSDDEFVAAVRDGKRPDGSLLYPAMPYPNYARMTRDEILAIRSYLNTVKPEHNAVKADRLPFPFNIRASMHVWDWLNFTPGQFIPDTSKPAEWNRGAYLVEGPAHCGACHTPKTLTGGDDAAHYLEGSTLQGWFAPDIRGSRAGIGSWSVEDIVAYLRTGHNTMSAATGSMAEEIALSTSQFTEPDLRAIAVYLLDLRGGDNDAKESALSPSDPRMTSGAAIYKDTCSACHGGDGKGVPELFPSLAGSSNARASDPTSLIRILLQGAQSVATAAEPTGPVMPSFAWRLNDAEAAAVLTYVRNAWGSAAAPIDEATVRKAREALTLRTDP